MAVSPAQAFKKLSEDDLTYIAEYRNLNVVAMQKEDPKTDLVSVLADDVSADGLRIVLTDVSKETLNKIAESEKLEYPGYDTKVKPSNRLIAKRLVEKMGREKGAKEWLQNCSHLSQILEDLEINVSAKDKEKAAKAVLAEADKVGLEHCLSAFAVDRLKEFAKNSKLKVYGSSREGILNALIDREDMARPEKKKKAKAPEPSKDKPSIKKGVTSVDLNTWFYRDDLSEWCEKNNIPSTGSKKDLVKRILDHHAGKDVSTKPKKTRKKAAAPKKKTTTTTKKTGTKRKAEDNADEKEGSNKKAKTAASTEEKDNKKGNKTTASTEEKDQKEKDTSKKATK